MVSYLNRSRAIALLLFLVFFNTAFASNYIIESDGLIDQRAIGKINEIGSEVKHKLGVNIYVYAKNDYGVNSENIKDRITRINEVENEVEKTLTKPYVLLTMALNQTHVNIIYSDKLKNIIDKDDILNGYVVPLLASKDKNTLFAKASAAILNGYAQIADVIAQSQGLKLESSIGSSGKTAGTIWKVFMYFLVVGGLLFYTYAVLKQKKLNKQ